MGPGEQLGPAVQAAPAKFLEEALEARRQASGTLPVAGRGLGRRGHGLQPQALSDWARSPTVGHPRGQIRAGSAAWGPGGWERGHVHGKDLCSEVLGPWAQMGNYETKISDYS